MQLPFLKKTEKEREFFLAVLLKPHAVGALLFEEQDQKLATLSHTEKNTQKELDALSTEELIEALDSIITRIEGDLPEGETVSKTIFAVPYEWVEEGKIKKPHLETLKKACEELDLKPIGFIVSAEAVVHSLQKSQGAPITSILVEEARGAVYVYLVRAGNIVEIKKALVEDSLVKGVEKALKHVEKFEVLPSKIVIFDHEGAERAQQEFLSHNWTQALPFLHFPQVTILEKGAENEAVAAGVASQMGIESRGERAPRERSLEAREEKEEQDREEKEMDEDIMDSAAQDFGFVKDEDILEKKEEQAHEEDFSGKETLVVSDSLHYRDTRDNVPYTLTRDTMRSVPFLTFIKRIKIPPIKLPISFMRFETIFARKVVFVVPVALILFLVLFSYVYYNLILRVDVTLFADKKTVASDMSLAFSPNVVTSAKNHELRIASVTLEAEGSDSRETSGKRETGDKAKGEVTVYNKTEQSKKFEKGTAVASSNGLGFVTTDDISVASTSAFSTNFSSAKVKVEAAKFGQEYNLPSGTNFTVGDAPTSSYFAKNEGAFSGGTKKNISVVAAKDLSDLEETVTNKAKDHVMGSAAASAGSDSQVLKTPLSVEFTEKNFDKKENDEAKSIHLSAKLKFTFGAYKTADLEALVKGSHEDIPSQYKLVKGDSSLELKDIKIGKGGSGTTTLHAKAVYAPSLDTRSIAKQISGKGFSRAEEVLRKLPGVPDSNINLRGRLPFMPNFLPFREGNIHITISSNG